jgi:hypothetical protein
MKLYKVTALSATRKSYEGDDLLSDGFGSRASAERFASGLASSGRAQRASISSYEDDDEDDDAAEIDDDS